MDIIKAFKNNDIGINITIQGSHEEPLFRASDIGTVLEMGNIRTSIQDFDSTEKCSVNIIDSLGRSQKTTFLTKKGLKKVICNSRKPNAVDLAVKLGIEVLDIFYIPLEISLVKYIKNIYSDEKITEQYTVGPYRVDLYFSELNIVIECDEYFHFFQKDDDIKREEYINNILDCKIIRFSQKGDRNDNIAQLIKRINEIINMKKDIKLAKLEKEIENKLNIIELKDEQIKTETEYLKYLKILLKKGVHPSILFPDDFSICEQNEVLMPRNGLDHKQEYTEYGFAVDEEMVDIINIFQVNKIYTNNSCQEQTGNVPKEYKNKTWICFDGLKDVERLFDMCDINVKFHKYLREQIWDVVLDSDNFEDHVTNVDSYNYSLRFPHDDLLYFTNELKNTIKMYKNL